MADPTKTQGHFVSSEKSCSPKMSKCSQLSTTFNKAKTGGIVLLVQVHELILEMNEHSVLTREQYVSHQLNAATQINILLAEEYSNSRELIVRSMNMILKIFRKKTETVESSRNGESNSNNFKRKSLKNVNNKSDSLPPPILESKASIVARKFLEATNNHSITEAKALMTCNCIVYFPDAEILGYALIEELDRINISFPDFKVSYERVEDVAPNVAKLVNIRASGTHTGEPYGFGPYPAIEPTGRKVLNDPEDGIITIDDSTGLITKMQYIVKGRLSGPPGLYEQIGGILF